MSENQEKLTVANKLKLEERTESNLTDIYLYKEGGFFRCYEWSAYLVRNFPSGLTEKEKLKVSKRPSKHLSDGYVNVGFPVDSFTKFLPGLSDDLVSTINNGNSLIVHASAFFDGFGFRSYAETLKEWKNGFGFKKEDNNKQQSNIYKGNNDLIEDYTTNKLIREIISYPVDDKTPLEMHAFILHVRKVACQIMFGEK